MKTLISFFAVMILLFFSYHTYATVATGFAFSYSAGTYTPITGGTVLAIATGNVVGPASLDDSVIVLPEGTFPFGFPYDGATYTGCFISSNGFITFGSAPAKNNYVPISSTAAYAGAISAVGGNNNGYFGTRVGEIRYQVIGSTIIIQYTHFKPSSSSSVSPNWDWNFQIRLSSDGTINIVYNNINLSLPPSSTNEVGLRGPNNTFATNVNNRLISFGIHTWATSARGTANNSTCIHIAGNIPVSGATFTWTPVQPLIKLKLKAIVEGLYYPIFNQLSRRDTAKILLRDVTSPYNVIDSADGIIDSLNFSCNLTYSTAIADTYYIVIKHFSSIETWSKSGGEKLIATTDTTSNYYDFTTSSSQAYGNNLIFKVSKWTIYSGDVNQDGVIDGTDINRIDNDAFNFLTGYSATDLNGDNFVDATDYSIADNNAFNFVTVIRP